MLVCLACILLTWWIGIIRKYNYIVCYSSCFAFNFQLILYLYCLLYLYSEFSDAFLKGCMSQMITMYHAQRAVKS